MLAYYFTVGEYIGFVAAKDKIELFWAIDEYCDPFGCKVKRESRSAGFCVRMEETFPGDKDLHLDAVHEYVESSLEVSCSMPYPEDFENPALPEKWRNFEEVFPEIHNMIYKK